MARSMLSLGIFSLFAERMAVRRRGLVMGSAPPVRAAMVNSRIILVKILPRLASVAAFLCLIVAHLECPDMDKPSSGNVAGAAGQLLQRQWSSRVTFREGRVGFGAEGLRCGHDRRENLACTREKFLGGLR